MEVDRNGLEILDREDCLRLVTTATLGRVGVSHGALPMILPVNFLLDRDHILIRTGRGTKLSAALRETVVAFEVDDIDPLDHSGWSVLITGIARIVSDPDELERLSCAPLPRWAPADQEEIVAIHAQLVSGRRLSALRPRHPPHKGAAEWSAAG